MTDSRNILIDVVFAKGSLTKISSADMREFVNYVYDEHMNKDNIADNLTTQNSTIALSANQGVELQRNIEVVNQELADTNRSISVNEQNIVTLETAVTANSQNIADNNTLALLNQKLTGDAVVKVSSLDNKVSQIQGDVSTLTIAINTIDNNLNQTNGIYDRIASNESNINDIKTILGQDTVDIKTLVSDIQLNKDNIDTINSSSIPDISNRITVLLNQANNDMVRIEKKTDSFRTDINNNEIKINQTNTAVVSALTAISNQNLNFTRINGDILKIEGDISNVLSWENTINASEAQIQNALVEINDNKNLSDLNKQKIDQADVHQKIQDQKIQTVETATNENTARSKRNESGLVAVQADNHKINNELVSLKSDHVTLGTNVTNMGSKLNTAVSDLVSTNKRVSDNAKLINDNKTIINTNEQTIRNAEKNILKNTNANTATSNRIAPILATQKTQQTEIVKNQTDITKLESGGFEFPKVIAKAENNQLLIQSKVGTNQSINIIGADENGTSKWIIGTEPQGPQDTLVISSKNLKLHGKDSVIIEKKDPNDVTKTKDYKILSTPQTVNPTNDGDMLFWNYPQPPAGGTQLAGEWGIQSTSGTRDKLDVFTKHETRNEIDTHFSTAIQTFETNTLVANYYNKTETLDKTEIQDALLYQVANTPLLNYGTDLGANSADYKAWEKLRNYSPQPSPTNETLIPVVPAGKLADLAAATIEIKRSRTEIRELQTKMNLLLTALQTSGVLI